MDSENIDAAGNEKDINEVIELDHDLDHDHVHDDHDDEDHGTDEDMSSDDADGQDDIADALEPIRDDSSCTFAGHTGPVFCVKFNPVNNAILATGGQDDKAYAWNATTAEAILECTGHKDSVSQIAFSHDGILLATGDMSGLLKVWNISTKEEIWSFEIADLEWLDWHFAANVLLASDAEGTVWIWKMGTGECKTYSNSGVAALTCNLLPDGLTLAVGYGDGTIKIWDMKTGTVKSSMSGMEAHEDSVTCLDSVSGPSGNLLITGGLDGKVNVFNFSSGKHLWTFECGEQGKEDKPTVESLSLCTSRPLAAVGTSDGAIFIIDLPSKTCRHKINNEFTITKVLWQKDSPLLYSADTMGVVSLWDGRTGESAAKFYGHSAEILDLAVSRQGVIFASSSEDGTAKVYAVSSDDAN